MRPLCGRSSQAGRLVPRMRLSCLLRGCCKKPRRARAQGCCEVPPMDNCVPRARALSGCMHVVALGWCTVRSGGDRKPPPLAHAGCRAGAQGLPVPLPRAPREIRRLCLKSRGPLPAAALQRPMTVPGKSAKPSPLAASLAKLAPVAEARFRDCRGARARAIAADAGAAPRAWVPEHHHSASAGRHLCAAAR